MALAVAFVACQAATPKAKDPDPGPPGKDAPPAPQRPYVDVEFENVKLAVTGEMAMKTIPLGNHFVDPDRKEGDPPLTYDATSAKPDVVTASVSGSTLTLTAVAEGRARITVKATDKDGLSSSGAEPGARFYVDVMKTVPPDVMPILNQTLYMDDDPMTITLTKAEADSGTGHFFHALPITYEVSISIPVVTAEVAEGVLTLTPLVVGGTTVTVEATTADGKPATDSFTVTVKEGSKPVAPMPEGMIEAKTLMVGGDPVTFDVEDNFSDADSDDLMYAASSSDDMTATAMTDGSMVTVTAVAAGMATITVTATDEGGRSATQMFEVTVEEAAKPTAPAKEGTISDVPDLMVRATTAEMDLSLYFSSKDEMRYTAASSDPMTADTSVADNMLTVTGIKLGGPVTITATATNAAGSTDQTFMVTVVAAETTAPPLTITILEGEKEKSVDLADYVPVPADYELELKDPHVFKVVSPSLSAPTVWKVTPVSMGEGKAWIIKKSDGFRAHELTIIVENREPTLNPDRPQYVATRLTNANKEDGKDRHSVSLPVAMQYMDADKDHNGKLSYTIKSSRTDVIIHKGDECSTSPCTVVVDIEVRRPNVSTFDLIVVAMDKAKAMSPPVSFPVYMESPRGQDYPVKEVNDANNWALKVGHRAGVSHTLRFTDPAVRASGHRYNPATAASGETPNNDETNGFQFAEESVIELALTDSRDSFAIAANHTDNVDDYIIYGKLKPDDLTGTPAETIDGSIDRYTVTSTGRVTVDEDSLMALGADPELMFKVTGTGLGTITIGYHVWYDSDGATIVVVDGPDTGTNKPMWYTETRTVRVTVVPVASEK